MYKKILVGFDGSEGSLAALTEAAHLAKKFGSTILALWVQGSLPHYPETVGELQEERRASHAFYERICRQAQGIVKKAGVPFRCESRTGHPAKTVDRFAREENVDLIVVGHSGHSGVWGQLLGHTAERISQNTHRSVLIVRRAPASKTTRKPRKK